MLSFHLRRFFTSSAPKLASYGQVKGVPATKLEKDDIQSMLKKYHLTNWKYGTHATFLEVHKVEENGLDRSNIHDKHEYVKSEHMSTTYVFNDFKHAFAFMDAMAGIIDQMDHHPEWQLVERDVDVKLTTHDAGNSVSYKDIMLARSMNYVAEKISNSEPKYSVEEKTIDPDEVFQNAVAQDPVQLEVKEAKQKEIEKAKKQASKSDKLPGDKVGDSSSDHYKQVSNL